MSICTIALLFASMALSADAKMPSDFLKVESKAWNQWLDEKINVGWKDFTLKDILDSAFGAAEMSIDNEKVLSKRITFEANKISRRTAIWQLSNKYKFNVRWTQKREPVKFLDLPETEEHSRSVGGISITDMTYVMRSDYEKYLELKRKGEISHEMRVEDEIYYSFDIDRDLHFANGTRAHIPAVQRYKTKAPKEKESVKSEKTDDSTSSKTDKK